MSKTEMADSIECSIRREAHAMMALYFRRRARAEKSAADSGEIRPPQQRPPARRMSSVLPAPEVMRYSAIMRRDSAKHEFSADYAPESVVYARAAIFFFSPPPPENAFHVAMLPL